MTIDDVNRMYAIVSVGNRMVVMQLAPDGSIVELWDYEHFRKRLIKEFIRVRKPDGKIKSEPLADVWLRHPRGRQYDRLVYSMPGSIVQATERDYNGWQGFSCVPKVGDWSLNRQHLYEIICGSNDENFYWTMNWLAALVQLPGRHAWTAIVLMGGQGIGKGHFANNMIGRLFGPQQYLHIIGAGQLTAEFNEHLSGKVLIYADESTWGGDPRAAAKLKGIITEDMVPINRKFLKMIDEPSSMHTIIASNNEWPIPIEQGDRRFSIFNVAHTYQQDQAYFGRLLAELENGGRAAMLAELLAFNVDHSLLRKPVMTAAKATVAERSAKPIEKWWIEVLRRGTLVDDTWPDRIQKRDLHANYLSFIDKHQRNNRDPHATETELGFFLNKYTPITQQRVREAGKIERILWVPDLATCRSTWVTTMGWPTNYVWGDEDDDKPQPDAVDVWAPPKRDPDEM